MAARRWTYEQRARQAVLVTSCRPWEQATGPKSPEGKAVVGCNAWKGGHRPMLRELAAALREQPMRPA